jgi:hypothetical protein
MYPVTFGGSGGDTDLEFFSIDGNMNLFITGKTQDSTNIVSTPGYHFAAFMLNSNPSAWFWRKEIPITSEVLISGSINSANTRVALLYDTFMLIVLNLTDGLVVKAQQGTPSGLLCSALYKCEG